MQVLGGRRDLGCAELRCLLNIQVTTPSRQLSVQKSREKSGLESLVCKQTFNFNHELV